MTRPARRRLLLAALLAVLVAHLAHADPESGFVYVPRADSKLLEATWSALPEWRGANITHLCDTSYCDGIFVEKEFRLLSGQGFNLARIPLDYRFWAPADDWGGVQEEKLKTLDDAVRWGARYDIHLSLDMHRAPGYCVNPPAEKESLWVSEDAQQAACRQWAMLARRYRDVPNRNMSFNLLNEPTNVDAATYTRVVSRLVEAIRVEDPDRLIIADGLDAATVPVPEMKALKIAQALHNYKPMGVTHYMASWVDGADAFPVPSWPLFGLSGYLYGPYQPELSTVSTIDGPFDKAAMLTLHVNQISNLVRLQVLCDGKATLDEVIHCSADPASCERVVYNDTWNIYQNIYDRDFIASIPAGTKKVELRLADGDWLTLTSLTLTEDGEQSTVRYTNTEWGTLAPGFAWEGGSISVTANAETMDRAWLRAQLQPWVDLKNSGVGVMVGEWGVYSYTPHDVVLRYAADSVSIFNECGFGWAMWNYFGPFGIIDSERADVDYLPVEGELLDEALYEVVKP